MLTHLYFVRHAHSTYTPDELGRPLSDRGSRDAQNIKTLFENKRVDHVISSPYQRALETVMVLIMNYFDKKYDYNFWRDLKMPDVYQLTLDGTNFVGAKHIISSEVY